MAYEEEDACMCMPQLARAECVRSQKSAGGEGRGGASLKNDEKEEEEEVLKLDGAANLVANVVGLEGSAAAIAMAVAVAPQ